MTKKDIIDEVSRRTGVQRNASQAVIDEAINIITENLCGGESIYIRGLFTLAPIKRAEKIARNIGKRTAVIIPAHYEPHAKFSKELRRKMIGLKVK